MAQEAQLRNYLQNVDHGMSFLVEIAEPGARLFGVKLLEQKSWELLQTQEKIHKYAQHLSV